MHENSINLMESFIKGYLKPTKKYDILDVGSYNINGSYKLLFSGHSDWEYKGLDIRTGPNVNLVAKTPYDWKLGKKKYDVIISGQCLEHTEAPWLWIKEMVKYLKKDGLVCIIAPWAWNIHNHPIDCWRVLPDGMRYLLGDWAGLEVLECFTLGNDCIGIARKRK